MKHRFAACLVLTFAALALSLPAVASTMIGPDVPECIIDRRLAENYRISEDRTAMIIKSSMPVVDIKEKSCFSSFMKIGGNISGSLKSMRFSFGDIVDLFSKAMCDQIDNAIDDLLDQAQLTYDAPYGLGGGTVGLDKDKKWEAPRIDTSGTTSLPQVERLAAQLGTEVGKRVTTELKSGRSKMTAINRDLSNAERASDDNWRTIRDRAVQGIRR